MATEEVTLEQLESEVAELRHQLELLGENHALDDSSDVPNTPTSGVASFSNASHLNYVSSADGSSYDTGRLSLGATGSLALTTSLQTMPGLSAALAVERYRIHAQLLCQNPNGSAGQGVMSFQVTASGGLTASSGRTSFVELGQTGSVATAQFATLGTLVASGGLDRVVYIDGLFDISVAGTISIQIKQAATVAITVVQFGTYLEVFPVT